MATKIYIQHTADGKSHIAQRSVKQGRKPQGLGAAFVQRLDLETEEKLLEIKSLLGDYYNKNEIVRSAAKKHVDFIYTELLKH